MRLAAVDHPTRAPIATGDLDRSVAVVTDRNPEQARQGVAPRVGDRDPVSLCGPEALRAARRVHEFARHPLSRGVHEGPPDARGALDDLGRLDKGEPVLGEGSPGRVDHAFQVGVFVAQVRVARVLAGLPDPGLGLREGGADLVLCGRHGQPADGDHTGRGCFVVHGSSCGRPEA